MRNGKRLVSCKTTINYSQSVGSADDRFYYKQCHNHDFICIRLSQLAFNEGKLALGI